MGEPYILPPYAQLAAILQSLIHERPVHQLTGKLTF